MTRILLVEDNPDLALGLINNLEIEGYGVEHVLTGQDALSALNRRANSVHYDLILLDLMLPDISGLKVLQKARKRGFETPILILTARGEESDKVRGLKLGADDYLTKPFGLLELLARIEALLRRGPIQPAHNGAIELGEIEIRTAQREVFRGADLVDLTPKEYDLLLALVDAKGAVVCRSDLLQKVWGYREDVFTRTVDTHIAELRRKIEESPSQPALILTVRKVGYRLVNE